MSMYNSVFGVNPMAGLLLHVLKLDPTKVPRFRDCFLWVNEYDTPFIVLYTRTGGGSREFHDSPNNNNMQGPYNSELRALPNFVKDEDDSYDSTYALFYYAIENKELAKMLMDLAEILKAETKRLPAERVQQVLADMQAGKETPDTKAAKEMIVQLSEQIKGMIK